jgi:hypothetical protein
MSFKLYPSANQQNLLGIKNSNVNISVDKVETTSTKIISGGIVLSPIVGDITRIQYSVIDHGANTQATIFINDIQKKAITLTTTDVENELVVGLKSINNIQIKKGDVIKIDCPLSVEFIVYMCEVSVTENINITKYIELSDEQRNTMFYSSNIPTVLDAIFD